MAKTVFIFMALLSLTGVITGQKPERIYSIAKVYKPHEYFVKQAENWWKEIERKKTDENAWYNYYLANRYSMFTYKSSDDKWNDDWTRESAFLKNPDEIYGLIEKNIPYSYTYYRFKKTGNPNDSTMFNALLKAYEINPDNPEIYTSFVTYYEMKGDAGKRKEFNEKIYHANQISAGFLAYGYNILMSIKPGGIIMTFSDNDTYPLWMLQDVFNLRKDVVVLNISLLMDPEYGKSLFKKINMPDPSQEYDSSAIGHRERDLADYIFKNKPASRSLYVGLPAWKQINSNWTEMNQTNSYEKNLYLVGLVLEYSSHNIDNMALLKNNFENNYEMDYIRNRFEYDISSELVDRININYLPGIFKLYEHYTLSGDLTNAKKMRDLGLLIAQKGGQEWLSKASLLLK
jgi:hypothetical protein